MKLNIYSEADGPGGILPTDSTEYELLREAAALGAHVPGMGCELGVRRGGGSRMIMDEFIKAGKYKTHVMVDPWGDIDYLTNEKLVRHTYTDYTNEMRNVCMVEIYQHYMSKPVNPVVIILEDTEFFNRYGDGVPTYNDKGKLLETNYCMVHLDGPHDSTVVNNEVDFFAPRMLPGAMLVCDDTNLYAHWENSHPHILQNFDEYKRGNRKIVYRRK